MIAKTLFTITYLTQKSTGIILVGYLNSVCHFSQRLDCTMRNTADYHIFIGCKVCCHQNYFK